MLAGCEFHHFVVDNGSEDRTALWLQQEYKPFHLQALPRNVGISRGSNLALDAIFREIPQVDVIMKIDNDCKLLVSDTVKIMAETVMASGRFGAKYVLSPFVNGINKQPTRGRIAGLNNRKLGMTAIVGGLFHAVPADVYRAYRYPTDLPLAAGQDDHFCNWVKRVNGGEVGYVEDLAVEHFEGTDAQAKRFPEYFERKWKEEKEVTCP